MGSEKPTERGSRHKSGRDDNRHREGEALLLSSHAQKTLRGWEPHKEGIIMASKRMNMNGVHIYSPINDATEEENYLFYNRFQGIIDKLPQRDINMGYAPPS